MNLINSVTSGINFNFGGNFFNRGMANQNNNSNNNYFKNDSDDFDFEEEEYEDNENDNDNEEENEEDLESFNKKKNMFIAELDEFQFKHLKKYSALKEDKCPICLQKYKSADIIKEFPCKHIFHKTCISKWLKKSNVCPICKHDLTEEINKIEIGEEEDNEQALFYYIKNNLVIQYIRKNKLFDAFVKIKKRFILNYYKELNLNLN